MLTAQRGALFVGALKREVSKHIYAECSKTSVGTAPRPHGLEVESMVRCNPALFRPGEHPLEAGAHKLQAGEMTRWHATVCDRCTWREETKEGKISPDCYFSTMIRCIEHGWYPPFQTTDFAPPYHVSGNYESTSLYRDGVTKELLGSMLANGAIRECARRADQVVTPLGAILKNSDKTRARAVVGINIASQETLQQANERLEAKGLPKVKVRVTMDCTATGVNGAALSPRFSYPNVKDGIEIVRRGCWLVVSDVSRYFHSFPWAAEMRPLMCIEWEGTRYECLGLSFGFTACPYYCSTWSAEFRRWVRKHIGPCAHMVDDWLLFGDTESIAQERGSSLAGMYHSVGLGMQEDKNSCGQVVKYLGIVIDTLTMTIRIDPIQALGTRLLLEDLMTHLRRGKPLNHGMMYHLAGKLNWFAEVLQSGRLHTHGFWDFLRLPTVRSIPARVRDRLLLDIAWWVRVLREWETQRGSGKEYRILSAAELQQDPASVYLIQSDASGEDGIGYAHGSAHDDELQWGSARWSAGGCPPSTHAMELQALRMCLESEGFRAQNCLLLWVTDAASAALSINKGNCANSAGFRELEIILEYCDGHGLELVAFWVPREENRLADYLSHLSAILHRESASGTTSDLATAASGHHGSGEADGVDPSG